MNKRSKKREMLKIFLTLIVCVTLANSCATLRPVKTPIIPVPPAPMWNDYTVLDNRYEGVVTMTYDDADTLSRNIEDLKRYATKMRIAIEEFNKER